MMRWQKAAHCQAVELPSVDGEEDFATAQPTTVSPVVVGVDLGVEGQFGEHEVDGCRGDMAVVFARMDAIGRGQIWAHALQFVDDEAVDRASVALRDTLRVPTVL